MPKYPDIYVPLIGQDGNAFFIIGRVRDALRRSGVDKDEIEEFCDEAMSGSYEHLLQTVGNWVDIFGPNDDPYEYEDYGDDDYDDDEGLDEVETFR